MPLWGCLLILFRAHSDECLHLAVLRWRGSGSKWIKANTMWKSVLCCDRADLLLPHTRLDAFALSLQLSADSSVIWLGGRLRPSYQCLLFLGKMAAIALLLPVLYMNRCDQQPKRGKYAEALCFSDTDHSRSSICYTQDTEGYSNAFLYSWMTAQSPDTILGSVQAGKWTILLFVC